MSCLFSWQYRIHAVCICDDAAVFHKDIDTILSKLGLSEDSEGRHAVQSKDIIDIIDGYKGHGNYGPSTDEELGIGSPSELLIPFLASSYVYSQLNYWRFPLRLASFLTQCTPSRQFEECWLNWRRIHSDSKETGSSTFTQVLIYYVAITTRRHKNFIISCPYFFSCEGGLFGAYDGRLEKKLRETPSSNQVSNF